MNRRKLLATSAVTLGALLVGEKDSKANMIVERRRRKEIPEDLERLIECQNNLQKANNVLEVMAGYSPKESAEIRKSVAKHLPKAKEYKQEFLTKAWRQSRGIWLIANSKFVEMWCAIAVTFCSAGLVDGFAALEIELPPLVKENPIA